jgi:uncharacterized protein (TIGR03000 family)
MLQHHFPRGFLLVASLVALLSPRPATAQYPVGDRVQSMTLGRSYYESRGPGYTAYYPSAIYASDYSFYPGKYTDDYRPSRFATSYGAYSTKPSGYAPIMMTSLNYPEVYGSYTMGLGPSGSVAPVFQTLPDNPPSDRPVGAPYAPLSRPLADVPYNRPSELTTMRQPAAQPALIDVLVPADATLSFQGTVMPETGSVRQFQSPPLSPGRTYSYDVQATWRTADGKDVTRTRQVSVSPGEHALVDLTREEMPSAGELGNERPMLHTLPLPKMREAPPAPKK